MKLAWLVITSLTAACASQSPRTTADASQPLPRACTVAECFNERDVRDFEVLNSTTLVLYVGPQRCAFRVDLTGTFCDLTFAPQVYFRRSSAALDTDERALASGARALNDKICANDIDVGVDGGAFTESQPVSPIDQRLPTSPRGAIFDNGANDRFGNRRSDCRVRDVASLTDDQLVELLVDRGVVAPPPPMGSGEIQVQGDQQQGGGSTQPTDGANAQSGQPTASTD
jgi:hypothetical protein